MWMEYCRSFFSREIVPLNFFYLCFMLSDQRNVGRWRFFYKNRSKKSKPSSPFSCYRWLIFLHLEKYFNNICVGITIYLHCEFLVIPVYIHFTPWWYDIRYNNRDIENYLWIQFKPLEVDGKICSIKPALWPTSQQAKMEKWYNKKEISLKAFNIF